MWGMQGVAWWLWVAHVAHGVQQMWSWVRKSVGGGLCRWKLQGHLRPRAPYPFALPSMHRLHFTLTTPWLHHVPRATLARALPTRCHVPQPSMLSAVEEVLYSSSGALQNLSCHPGNRWERTT